MTVEKTHYSNQASQAANPHAPLYSFTGPTNHCGFKQCLDESKENQQTVTKKSQSDDACKKTRLNLTAGDLCNSKQSTLLGPYPNQTEVVNPAPLFFHAGIISVGLGSHQVKLFKDLAAVKKFQKHFDNLVAHARLNCNISSIKESSTIIFESSDCTTDRYTLSFDKVGYTLSVETQTKQFAADLTCQAEAFEGYFFNKTACSLHIEISITKA